MRYEIFYDRKSARYRVQAGEGEQSSSYFHHIWSWLGEAVEPGDTIYWSIDA
ncbi:hypothetical protein PBI_GAIA_80 [Mycobacterium phage Gaia]|uniref:DUF7372 domain-containing protein n=1 Tax=Mycobacterium phage Gaia TaxID=1486472 RepID=A0A068F2G8_9CAUD|nr:hypothetical protein VC46_gp153 [Mycobacterium phage Gaia]AID58899.1 hypothetical protein PBI_GAIA_80 [Mycobacterium phage Gaia]AYR00018.1 hypothetical protein PBI_NEBKISS_79 [Mycobacterium phage Nebkiss]